MNFKYLKISEKYNYASQEKAEGIYNGPSEMNIKLNESRKMDDNGSINYTLKSSNPDHIIIMDIIDGSKWFDFENTPNVTEKIGPHINILKEKIFAPKSVYDEANCVFNENGSVDFAYEQSPISYEDVITTAENEKIAIMNIASLTLNEKMKNKLMKIIQILDWIIYEWDEAEFPAYKIVIPTIDTIENFN